MTTLAKLCKVNDAYHDKIFPILLQHLEKCRPKEVAQHAERISICITSKNLSSFTNVLEKRVDYLTPSQKSRIDKLLRKLQKM